MAIAIDKSSLGSNAGLFDNSVAFNTTQAVASGGFIVAVVAWWTTGMTLTSVSDSVLGTWAIDKQRASSFAANMNIAIASVQAPSGLASSTTITAAFSSGNDAKIISALSFTGVLGSAALDTTANGDDQNSGGWTTNNVSIAAGSVLVGASWSTSTWAADYSTITSPSIEALDWGDATNGFGGVAGYRIESSAGSYAVAGTWDASTSHTTIAAAYKAAAGTDKTGAGTIGP